MLVNPSLAWNRTALRWALPRLAVYVLAPIVSMAAFLVWAAFYAYVWPAPQRYQPAPAPVMKTEKPPAPLAPIVVPRPNNQSPAGPAIVRAPADNLPAGEIAQLVTGTQIFDSNNVIVGRVERLKSDKQGEQEVVVNVLGPLAGSLTFSADEVHWTFGKDGQATRGTIPFSIVDIRQQAEALMASKPAGSQEPVRLSVPSTNSTTSYVTLTPGTASTILKNK